MAITPSTTTYNRLECSPFAEDSERSLRAEVRDALWMLTRQWQLGEFAGEDAGSAILSRIKAQLSPVCRYLPGQAMTSQAIPDMPLEVLVERELPPMDLLTRIEMGRQFMRMLAKAVTDPATLATYKDRFLNGTTPRKLRLTLPAEGVDSAYLYSNRRLRQAAALITAGNLIDGGALFDYLITSSANKASKWLAAVDTTVDTVGNNFLAWYRRVYSQPATKTETLAYQEDALSYKFAVSAPQTSTTGTPLRASAYPGGHLDWYSFDIDTNADAKLKPTTAEFNLRSTKTLSVIPTETRFPGMPKARWWEFEDGRVNLYGSSADALNPATLVYNEFALLFSNDWMIAPLTVPVGQLVEVQQIVITDTFGQRIKVSPAGSGTEDYKLWSFFNLHQTGASITGGDFRLLMPQVIGQTQSGPALERVHFLRDEMANMVWAVEELVPDGLGGSIRGQEAAQQLLQYLSNYASSPTAAPLTNSAELKYALSTAVPEHWIPFIAVKAAKESREIRLQRSSLPRVLTGMEATRVLPRTGIVAKAASPYYVNEEEVPRAGTLMERGWQRTRWYNGKTFTWVGRTKTTGRGEGSSGLKFDSLK